MLDFKHLSNLTEISRDVYRLKVGHLPTYLAKPGEAWDNCAKTFAIELKPMQNLAGYKLETQTRCVQRL